MNNALNFAMQEVCSTIPPEILEVALRTYNYKHHENATLSVFLMKEIIEGRVLNHCNLSGGQVKTFPMRPEYLEKVNLDHKGFAGDDGPYSFFRIPPEVRENRPITAILAVQYPVNTFASNSGVSDLSFGVGGLSLTDQVYEVLNSYTLSTPRNHPIGILKAGDLIEISPSQYTFQPWLVTVRIAYDKSFQNLSNHAVPILANLVVLATKQWVWTNCTIGIDRAVQESGCDIGTFRATVDEYRDAGQLFQEELIKWRGTTNMDDKVRHQLIYFAV